MGDGKDWVGHRESPMASILYLAAGAVKCNVAKIINAIASGVMGAVTKREYRSATTPCPYCANPDRNSIFDAEHPWNGCKHVTSKSGEDPPCVCDGYASSGQLSTLGLAE